VTGGGGGRRAGYLAAAGVTVSIDEVTRSGDWAPGSGIWDAGLRCGAARQQGH